MKVKTKTLLFLSKNYLLQNMLYKHAVLKWFGSHDTMKSKRKTLPKDFEALLAKGDIAALKAVFDLCDVNARGGSFKQTALAFNECPDELVRWLAEQGADLAAGDNYGETPLHSRAGHWQGRIEVLIELGADVNHDAGGRSTPLHRAAAVGNARAARLLLDNGADVNAVNDTGQTPLVFALERCDNSSIERMVPMAELLLDAMAAYPSQYIRPFLSRVFGGKSKVVSPITPQAQALVQRIGSNFEFHRAGFNPETVDAVNDALNRLYALFDVAPVPRRVQHDGVSLIVAKAARWEDRHQELWELLVPSAGAATTVQGEVIRISGRVSDELDRNGAANWDSDYKKMCDAFITHISSAHPLPGPDLEAVHRIVSEIKSRQGDAAQMCRLAVDWVALNPEPIKLPTPDYRR